MSKLVGTPVAALVAAARGNMDVVKSAVEALSELARQPYRSDDAPPSAPPAPPPPAAPRPAASAADRSRSA
jgi:hypothetical protein